jgi:mono/diheme cytochrome c family protein
MRPIVLFIGLSAAAALSAAAFAAAGIFDVSATRTPGKFEERLARFVVDRSIARRAEKTRNPLPANAQVWSAGLPLFRANCVVCHGAPGVDPSEGGASLNPPAPGLTLPRVQARPDGELFWIVGHGIRMTGMPAFGPSRPERELWEIVAFVRHLPALSPDEKKALKALPVASRPE